MCLHTVVWWHTSGLRVWGSSQIRDRNHWICLQFTCVARKIRPQYKPKNQRWNKFAISHLATALRIKTKNLSSWPPTIGKWCNDKTTRLRFARGPMLLYSVKCGAILEMGIVRSPINISSSSVAFFLNRLFCASCAGPSHCNRAIALYP